MKTFDFRQALELDPKKKGDVEKLLSYVDKVFSNGTLNLFSPLMQTDYRILMYLVRNPGAQPSVLAEQLNVTRPNVAANLRILDEKKYIVRRIDETNHRQIHVYLTEEGKRHIHRVGLKLNFLFASWLDILGPEECQHLFRILDLSCQPNVLNEDLKKMFLDD